MTVKVWGVDRLHLRSDYHSESNSEFHIFSFLFKMLFIYFLFMKLTHIQVFKKRMHEARIKCFCLQPDNLFFLWMFCMFRYSYNNIYKLINRDIVVYLKYDVSSLKETYEYTCSIKLLS